MFLKNLETRPISQPILKMPKNRYNKENNEKNIAESSIIALSIASAAYDAELDQSRRLVCMVTELFIVLLINIAILMWRQIIIVINDLHIK